MPRKLQTLIFSGGKPRNAIFGIRDLRNRLSHSRFVGTPLVAHLGTLRLKFLQRGRTVRGVEFLSADRANRPRSRLKRVDALLDLFHITLEPVIFGLHLGLTLFGLLSLFLQAIALGEFGFRRSKFCLRIFDFRF